MADNRGDLIQQLAASMGAGEFAATKYEESRYDSETGTLYCDGIAISKPIVDKAEAFFKSMKSKCSYTDPASREMAMIYQVGIEGIHEIKKNAGKKTQSDS